MSHTQWDLKLTLSVFVKYIQQRVDGKKVTLMEHCKPTMNKDANIIQSERNKPQ